jgi:signal transduction histidine kinase
VILPASDATSARVQAELLRSLQGNLLGIGLGNAAVALAMAVALRQHAAPLALALWLAAQMLHSGFSVWAWWRVRQRPVSLRAAPHRARASVWASGFSGALWALALPLFWPAAQLELQLLMLTLITGLVSGAVHSLSAHLPAFRAFFVPNVLAVIAMCLWHGGLLHGLIALAALAYGVTGARFAGAMHRVQRGALEQREELARLAADLAEQKRVAEEASSAKSRFLAAASHDIRQPVHALGLFLGAFDDAALSGRNAQLIGPLRESARGLREMLDGVLDLSRAEAGAVQAQPENLAAQTLLERIEREFAPQAEQRGLLLRVVPSRSVVRADAVLTARVLGNLVANGLRYTAKGGVLVAARRRGSKAVFEVWDTGAGIAPEEQQRLFGEFVRGAEASRAEPTGLGLGLAIAARFCAAQDSRLEVASRPGRGTVFRFALPLATGAAEPISKLPSEPGPDPDLGRLAGLKVLLLDDDAAVRNATAALLDSWGCEVVARSHPDLVEPGAAMPDLAITDNLFDGVPLAAELARRWPGVPLVVSTGEAQAASLASLRERGVPVLAKPVEPMQLHAAMRAARPVAPPPQPGGPGRG